MGYHTRVRRSANSRTNSVRYESLSGRVGGVVTEPLPPQTRACAIDALGSSPDRFAQCLFGYPLLFRQRVGGTQGFLQRFPSVALYR